MLLTLTFVTLFGPTFNQGPAKKPQDAKLDAVLRMWEKQYTEIRNMRCVIKGEQEDIPFTFGANQSNMEAWEFTTIRPDVMHLKLQNKQDATVLVRTKQGYQSLSKTQQVAYKAKSDSIGDLINVLIYGWNNMIFQGLSLATGNIPLPELKLRFALSVGPENESYVWLIGDPLLQNDQRHFRRIIWLIDKRKNQIVAGKYYDIFGGKVGWTLSGIETNVNPPPTVESLRKSVPDPQPTGSPSQPRTK